MLNTKLTILISISITIFIILMFAIPSYADDCGKMDGGCSHDDQPEDRPDKDDNKGACHVNWKSSNNILKKEVCEANTHPSNNIVMYDDDKNCLLRMSTSPDALYCHIIYQTFDQAFENRRNSELIILFISITLDDEFLGFVKCITTSSRIDCYISETQVRPNMLMLVDKYNPFLN